MKKKQKSYPAILTRKVADLVTKTYNKLFEGYFEYRVVEYHEEGFMIVIFNIKNEKE